MSEIIVKWLGHASFQIKTDNKIIYIDPYEGEYEEKADIVLVTHSHYDHCDTSKIKKIIKKETVIIAPEECARKINAKSIKPGEKITINGITIQAVHAYNIRRFRSPGVPFHPKGFGVGYLITIGDKTIYHAGDTDFIPEMKELKNITLALLPSGGTYTMDNPEAAEATITINPKIVIPMHRWDTNPEEFKKKVEEKSSIKVVILNPGEIYKLE
ncbi:MAG: MBL fold metallo-hydrolase [Candidatus Methanomethylicota archaeon]|uniref:MBL fold metallo-hydrolase n=1 Tax=Thermoproteota archaeon TaxID=2056631 RepID=A0A523BC60_9CREN|nr:MAG: MBL fold metallo-hydrolase [Candidatus Verstraetearchaeota archaeon]TDA38495.1 MAG: MBL fold metallo-hydrolase [Candidatus Verstraetearchaeota archaeon]